MDRLFTPWRFSYVTEGSAARPSCVFCDAAARADESLVVHRGDRAFVILNKFPYNSGHVMVVPYRHAPRLADLEAEELTAMITLAQRVERALTDVYQPQGFNMGVNVGTSAGAGIADHLHLHIVPRWTGDTSFMTVVGDARVLPEELGTTAARLHAALSRLAT